MLHLSEHAAYLRIEAARAARKWPVLVELVAEGALHLTAIGLLAPHLTPDNHEGVLTAARHKTKREVEVIVAELRPQPPVPSMIRKVAVVPFADGGAADADNLELRCRAHNAFEAERWFGVSGEDVVRDARAGFSCSLNAHP